MSIVREVVIQRTCRTCMQKFNIDSNNDNSCRYHPESYAGETAQRWLAPGVTQGITDKI